jgi:NitT/TauT family transport system substrate-binding protein
MARPGVLLVAVMVLLSGCVPAAAPVAAPTATPAPTHMVTIYGNVSGDFSPLWAAVQGGYFAHNGLDVDVQMIGGGPQSLAAVLGGQAHVDQVGGSEVLSAVAQGADLVVVAVLMPVFPYRLYVAPGITSPEALRGKKIDIVNFGGSVDVATRLALPRLGLNPDTDVTFVPTGTHQNGTAALLSGAVQARMDNPPASAELEAHGFPVLLDLAQEQIPTASTSVVVTRAYASEHRATVQAYVDSLLQAQARLRQDEPFALSVLKTWFKSDDEAAMKSTYDFFLGEAMRGPPFPRAEQFRTPIQVLRQKNPAVDKVDVDRLVDATFVQSAVDRGLAAP